jgi:hypothetical protein
MNSSVQPFVRLFISIPNQPSIKPLSHPPMS